MNIRTDENTCIGKISCSNLFNSFNDMAGKFQTITWKVFRMKVNMLETEVTSLGCILFITHLDHIDYLFKASSAEKYIMLHEIY